MVKWGVGSWAAAFWARLTDPLRSGRHQNELGPDRKRSGPSRLGCCFVVGLGEFVDPVDTRGSNRTERRQVVGEGFEVESAFQSQRRVEGAERAEAVTAIGQEAIDRHDVGRAGSG